MVSIFESTRQMGYNSRRLHQVALVSGLQWIQVHPSCTTEDQEEKLCVYVIRSVVGLALICTAELKNRIILLCATKGHNVFIPAAIFWTAV